MPRSQISQEAQGYLFTPGIFSSEQIEGWKRVTEEVHRDNGKIFIQLWHVGRISHVSIQREGKAPVSSVDTLAKTLPAMDLPLTASRGKSR